MNRLTLFRATLVPDSALSISGVDRESTCDAPFTIVGGSPVMSGRGLKGAAVAMARRFFDTLPSVISGEPNHRSAWEFSNSKPSPANHVRLPLRAGVGICQKTGARASGVLFDREVTPAGTRWPLVVRVDWSWAGSEDEAREAEGILGYVLAEHWANGRCWLGGNVARGLGWCHLENLVAYRLDDGEYDVWVTSGRNTLPSPLPQIPVVGPTRSWCFRTLEVQVRFGEYRADGEAAGEKEAPWGLDMFSVGPHDADRGVQSAGSGVWARPSWASGSQTFQTELETDHALLMEGNRPLLPGASVRGPMRHAFSRAACSCGESIQDPHCVQGKVGEDDSAGKIFGTVAHSSRVLISDARALDDWAAAKLHMHAEDEFSAGSYGSSKRDAVRLLKGIFPVRIVVEGETANDVNTLISSMDKLVSLGALGHLPVGGHKTRGAGWGQWIKGEWQNHDVAKSREAPHARKDSGGNRPQASTPEWRESDPEAAWIAVEHGMIATADLTLSQAAAEAMKKIGQGISTLVAWWCEPAIDFTVTSPPEIFGWQWPENAPLRIDEAAFFLTRGSWRVARTAKGNQWVFIHECGEQYAGTEAVQVSSIPTRLHGSRSRFSARSAGEDRLIVREWRSGATAVGFTLNRGKEQ